MRTYKWKKGYIYNADATIVAKEIREGKQIELDEILEIAEDENTEVHKCFTWEDGVAAEKYRKEEARNLLQHLVFVVVTKDNREIEQRVYVSIKQEDEEGNTERVYVNAEKGFKEETIRNRIFAELKDYLKHATDKIDEYNEIVNYLLDK